jgi:uncharacterized protein YdaU (DUF1376 family)
MSLPWMPLYIGAYLKKTSHLGALESGAYLHLIMAYWVSGRLPNDDKQLATIAKMTMRQWKESRETLAAFFGPNWTHERIDEELEEASKKAASASDKGRTAAKARWSSKDAPSIPPSTAQVVPRDAPSHSPSPKVHDDEEAPEPLVTEESNRLSDEIATIVGHDLHFVPPAWFGASYSVQKWLSNGWRREIILASVREQMQRRRGDKPDKIIYFEKGIAAAHARHAAPLPTAKIIEGETVNVHAKPESSGNVIAAQDRLVARIADFNKPAPKFGDGGIRGGEGADAVRLLPER